MARDVNIRQAEPTDVDGIYKVMRESRREAFDGLLPPDALNWEDEVSDGFREFVQDTTSHPEKRLFVAVCDDTVVGIAEMVWQPAETQAFVEEAEAELKAIHVRPDRWNEGIGTKLLTEAIDPLPSHVSGVALCVLAENERARAFYKRRGFDQEGTTVTTFANEERTEVVYRRPVG